MPSTTRVTSTETAADVRAREVEEEMTDDERFSLIISLLGAVPFEDTLLHNDHVPNGNCAEASKPSGRQTEKPCPRGITSDAFGPAATCHRGGGESNQCRRRGPNGTQYAAQPASSRCRDRQPNCSALLWLICNLCASIPHSVEFTIAELAATMNAV